MRFAGAPHASGAVAGAPAPKRLLPPPEVRLPVIPSKTEGALVDIERESSP